MDKKGHVDNTPKRICDECATTVQSVLAEQPQVPSRAARIAASALPSSRTRRGGSQEAPLTPKTRSPAASTDQPPSADAKTRQARCLLLAACLLPAFCCCALLPRGLLDPLTVRTLTWPPQW
jgi:hypothetical protein